MKKVKLWAKVVWLAILGKLYFPSQNTEGSGYTSTGEGVQGLG